MTEIYASYRGRRADDPRRPIAIFTPSHMEWTDIEHAEHLLKDLEEAIEKAKRDVVLPCPCCGGIAYRIQEGDESHLRCEGCGLRTPSFKDWTMAVERWNRRVRDALRHRRPEESPDGSGESRGDPV